ncbi:hypothetical protein HY383_00010 [Candidatus Daviesbacteria bacterium]|nr:hypothetical protein [Candidatus Daviesbacteria bacterium]
MWVGREQEFYCTLEGQASIPINPAGNPTSVKVVYPEVNGRTDFARQPKLVQVIQEEGVELTLLAPPHLRSCLWRKNDAKEEPALAKLLDNGSYTCTAKAGSADPGENGMTCSATALRSIHERIRNFKPKQPSTQR